MPGEKNIILRGPGLTKVFGFGRQKTLAVDHVDFNFYEGEVVLDRGLIGQWKDHSGADDPGVAQCDRRGNLLPGQTRDIRSHKKKQEYWKNIQAIFQDPFSAYNTFHKVDAVLLDCIRMRGGGKLPTEKKVELMTEACSFVNMKYEELTNKYPFELSGGQMQRSDDRPHLPAQAQDPPGR